MGLQPIARLRPTRPPRCVLVKWSGLPVTIRPRRLGRPLPNLSAKPAMQLVDAPRFERGTPRRETDLQSVALGLSAKRPVSVAPRARLERATPSFVGWRSESN